MNENLYIAHKKLPHKTLRVHSARYTQCIHVSSRKLKLPKDSHTEKYKQLLPTHPFPKVELYVAVKCKNIYKVTNNDNRKKENAALCVCLFSFCLPACLPACLSDSVSLCLCLCLSTLSVCISVCVSVFALI